jgi:hypothetical protein
MRREEKRREGKKEGDLATLLFNACPTRQSGDQQLHFGIAS